MPITQGTNCIVLHGHLPWVHYPGYDDFLEEDWYLEALAETYLPILAMLNGLRRDRIPTRLTIGLTPPLLEMFRAPALCKKADHYLERRRELAESEVAFYDKNDPRHATAQHYLERFRALEELWQSSNKDLVTAFREHQNEGRIEILASCATHAVLPLLHTRESRLAQLRIGIELYREVFGRSPQGFWLPECAFQPELDPLLAEVGIRYVILEGHGVKNGTPPSPFGVHRPVRTPSGIACFGRDPASSLQVWATEVGYPGDPDYREFYRDLGYDGDYDRVSPYLHSDGVRRNLGLKYHRVTGSVPLDQKEYYDLNAGRGRARVHAGHFLWARGEQARHLNSVLGEPPCVLSPYDMELFGHWWYEGPWFLDGLFRQMNDPGQRPPVRLITPGQVIREAGSIPTSTPILSTWGEGGYLKVWLNEKNTWVHRHQQEMERRMVERVRDHSDPTPQQARMLDQMLRELLLLQSSDWAFIITKDTTVHYAKKRVAEHVQRFLALESALQDPSRLPDKEWELMISEDSLFPGIDHRLMVGGPVIREGCTLGSSKHSP